MVLGVILVIVLLVFGAVGFIGRPGQWPTSKNPVDQWTALGTVYGGGAFLLAAFAAVLATIAYVNSTEKPRLVLTQTDYPVDQLRDWRLSLRLENQGLVAARFVAIRLKFNGARVAAPYANFPMGTWMTVLEWREETTETQWEGGADVVIHANWPYQVPLFKCEVRPSGGDWSVDVEVVADEVPSFTTRIGIGRG